MYNGRTFFKNLAVWIPQSLEAEFGDGHLHEKSGKLQHLSTWSVDVTVTLFPFLTICDKNKTIMK